MLSSMRIVLTLAPAMAGVGLILSNLMFPGIVLLLAGAGLGLADFRWALGADGSARRLIARGSPALLMVALMLGAAQGYVASKDAALRLVTAQIAACPTADAAQPLTIRALDLLR